MAGRLSKISTAASWHSARSCGSRPNLISMMQMTTGARRHPLS